jgi:hypothetical protein
LAKVRTKPRFGNAPNFGVIAQLGERFNGIEEVGGSIPPGSTSVFQGLRLKTLLIFRIGILISYNSEKGIYGQGPSYRDLIASGVRLRTK